IVSDFLSVGLPAIVFISSSIDVCVLSRVLHIFLFSCSRPLRDFRSFPTRRSSDLPSSVTFASLQVKSPLARQYFVSSPLAWLLRHLAAFPRRRARLGPEVSGAPAPSRVPSGPVEDAARWL